MKMSVAVLTVVVSASLAACGKAPDTTNVADASNSAGAALENSAAELDATTDNLVDSEVANINAGANAATTDGSAGDNAVLR